VLQILVNLKEKGHDTGPLLQLIKRYEAIKILELIESDNTLPKKDIFSFTKDFFDLHENHNDYTLHKSLFELSKKIITTNYDTAFERSNSVLQKHKAYKGRNYDLTTHKYPDSPLLFKLHGCYEDPDSMVLFPSQYKNLYNNKDKDAEHSLLVLKNIIINKSILFIGTGMGDFQINNLFSEVKKLQGDYNQMHFIITKSTLDSALNFLTPIKIHDYTEIQSIIDALIKIKKNCKSDESHKMLELKKELKDVKEKLEKYENDRKDKVDKDKLLKRESLKYFGSGIEFHLKNEFQKAIEKYQTATELNPLDDSIYNNWGSALGNLAKTKEGKEADELYNEAFDKYQKAIEIKPDKHQALYSWGTNLGNLAKTKEGKEADELYNEAFDKYQKAIDIKPDDYEALYNWGIDLGNLAKTKEGKEADELYNEAFDKFKKAIGIKPDKHEAFNNWGTDLGNLAKTREGKEADELYKEAFDKFQKAIKYGASSYNLSCIYALKGEKDNALKYLDISLSNNEIDVVFVENDEDWKDYLEDDDFIELLNNYKK